VKYCIKKLSTIYVEIVIILFCSVRMTIRLLVTVGNRTKHLSLEGTISEQCLKEVGVSCSVTVNASNMCS
jgi:hypothetical protein